ncbi:MAG: hypothetical protein Q8L68_00535, partial [Methylococcales bacterium]|nr:hypothetical protein [Methylococcales bacterium]
SSVCKTTTAKGQVITLAENTLFNLNSASKLTVICKRNMRTDGSGNLFADDQTLFFNTSTGAYQVPLAGIGSLSRSTVIKAMAQIRDAVDKDTQTILTNTTNTLTTKINTVSNNQSVLNNKFDIFSTSLSKWTPIPEISLGNLPVNPLSTVTYNLPNTIPADAKEVLVYTYITTGYAPGGIIKFKIYTEENSVQYYQYLIANGYAQNAVAYNSDNIWLPITSARTLMVTSSGSPIGPNFASGVVVMGYR